MISCLLFLHSKIVSIRGEVVKGEYYAATLGKLDATVPGTSAVVMRENRVLEGRQWSRPSSNIDAEAMAAGEHMGWSWRNPDMLLFRGST